MTRQKIFGFAYLHNNSLPLLLAVSTFFLITAAKCTNQTFRPEAEVIRPEFTNINSALKAGRIAIVSHNSPADLPYQADVRANHEQYAKKHGYDYYFRNGNISGTRFLDPSGTDKVRQLGLYWQKIAAVQELLKNPMYDWVLWIDSDAIFTNMTIRLEDIIQEYGGGKDFIIAPDRVWVLKTVRTNTGVFLTRRSRFGIDMMHQVELLYPVYKNYVTPEQHAIQDLIYGYAFAGEHKVSLVPFENRTYADERIAKQVAIIPQSKLNAFYDPSASYPEEATWHPGYFIGHVLNKPKDVRLKELLKQVVH